MDQDAARTIEISAAPTTIEMTTDIVAAYLSNNPVDATQLQDLIRSIHDALNAIANGPAEPAAAPLEPAVPVKRSVNADYIVCLEDGRKFKSLKRHLRSQYNLTPDEYRTKWGLPKDYPMVAPNYAQARSALARAMGLGQGGRQPSKNRKKKEVAAS